MPRTVAVGDIHGCFDELRDLLDRLDLGSNDRLISVGDLVGKGPLGYEVVRFFRKNGYAAVRGNHDDKLLAARESPRSLPPSHRRDAQHLNEADWDWLGGLPYWIRLRTHRALVVHAGLVPGVPLKSQDPLQLTTLRSIRRDGTTSKRVDGGAPWASQWPGPELVLFGHDAVRGLQRWPHAIGLDSGCVYGGKLSAYVMPEATLVQVRARQAYAT